MGSELRTRHFFPITAIIDLHVIRSIQKNRLISAISSQTQSEKNLAHFLNTYA